MKLRREGLFHLNAAITVQNRHKARHRGLVPERRGGKAERRPGAGRIRWSEACGGAGSGALRQSEASCGLY